MANQGWKQFERDVCRRLAAFHYPNKYPMSRKLRAEDIPFRRTPGSGAWAGRKSMAADVQGPKSFIYSVECKRQKAWTFDQIIRNQSKLIATWWKQTVKSAKKSERIPMLVFTKPHMGVYVRVSSALPRLLRRHGIKLPRPLLKISGYSYFKFEDFLVHGDVQRANYVAILEDAYAENEIF